MTPRDVARAARAIFDIVTARGEGERAAASLESLASLTDSHEELRRALHSPFIPATAKQGILDALAGPLDMPDAVRRSLHLIAEHGALNDLPRLAAHVRQLVNRQAGVVDATVTTAVPLSPAQLEALQARLSEATGKRVSVKATVNPDVLGGVVARVGGVVYDGTLARQLARLHEQLVQRS